MAGVGDFKEFIKTLQDSDFFKKIKTNGFDTFENEFGELTKNKMRDLFKGQPGKGKQWYDDDEVAIDKIVEILLGYDRGDPDYHIKALDMNV